MNNRTCRGLAGILLFTLLATLFVLPGRALADNSTDNNDAAAVTLTVGTWFAVMFAEEQFQIQGQDHPSDLSPLSPIEFSPSMEELENGHTDTQYKGFLHGWGNVPWKIEIKVTNDEFLVPPPPPYGTGHGIHLRAGVDGATGIYPATYWQDFWQSGEGLYEHNSINLHWKLYFDDLAHTPATPPEGLSETVTVQISAADVD